MYFVFLKSFEIMSIRLYTILEDFWLMSLRKFHFIHLRILITFIPFLRFVMFTIYPVYINSEIDTYLHVNLFMKNFEYKIYT